MSFTLVTSALFVTGLVASTLSAIVIEDSRAPRPPRRRAWVVLYVGGLASMLIAVILAGDP